MIAEFNIIKLRQARTYTQACMQTSVLSRFSHYWAPVCHLILKFPSKSFDLFWYISWVPDHVHPYSPKRTLPPLTNHHLHACLLGSELIYRPLCLHLSLTVPLLHHPPRSHTHPQPHCPCLFCTCRPPLPTCSPFNCHVPHAFSHFQSNDKTNEMSPFLLKGTISEHQKQRGIKIGRRVVIGSKLGKRFRSDCYLRPAEKS